jgi:hypothetical protein
LMATHADDAVVSVPKAPARLRARVWYL